MLVFFWLIGYISIGRIDIFSQSYFFVYSLGIMLALNGIFRPNIKTCIASICVLCVGMFFSWKFYFARVAGDYMYAELIDRFDSKLQLNPPNISIILYSIGLVLVAYHLSEFADTSFIGRRKICSAVYSLICVLGMYSLDIFLWHLFIRTLLMEIFVPDNIWIRRIMYYSVMLFLPVVFRLLADTLKHRLNENILKS